MTALFIATLIAILGFQAYGQNDTIKGISSTCPRGAITISPGSSIQAAVDRGGENASFCLRRGIHRVQVIRPYHGQSFYGESGAILNGARLVPNFGKQGRFWTAALTGDHESAYGQCLKGHETCNLPLRVYIDDKPLMRALSLEGLEPGFSFFDHGSGQLFVADDPTGRNVEVTVGRFAFQSRAPGVSIKGLLIEKYASPPQNGAINGKEGVNWKVEDCEVRFNSGAGVTLGAGGSIIHSNVHHNGQLGVGMEGVHLTLEHNRIWLNNVFNFNYNWEAGGAKITEGNGVHVSDNVVYDNNGPGLWCDINCHDVVYERNNVYHNADAGIYHEISRTAIIRSNTISSNGYLRNWYWGAQIQICASEGVEVYDNEITVGSNGNGIILVDQGRVESGISYRTSSNYIHNNIIRIRIAGSIGGISDTNSSNNNYRIIESSNNRFDHNVYELASQNSKIEFVWGHDTYDWNGFRKAGQESNGSITFVKQ